MSDVFLLLNHKDQGALDQFESRIRALTTTDDLTLPSEPVGDSPESSQTKSFIVSTIIALLTGATTEIGKQIVIESIKFILKI